MNNVITANYENLPQNKEVSEIQRGDEPFLDSYHDAILKDSTKDTFLSYEEIKNISIKDIESYFGDTTKQQELRNLYMATQFSSDPNMSLALFEHAKNLSLEDSTRVLADMFTHKNIYQNNMDDSSLRSMLLRKSIIDQIEDPTLKAQQERLEKEFNETMLQIDMMEYFNDLLDFGRDEKERDKASKYGYLFNNFYNRYEMMKNLYEDTKNSNQSLLNQYLGYNPLKGL